MEESGPTKHKATSKVIDSLHTKIDLLNHELEDMKMAHDEYKKKHLILSKRNELYVDQLANAKHETDMVNALLKRKERRILDLEDLYNEMSALNESLTLTNKNMRIRCDNLQESTASSTAEYERLKIAYDALMASQVEYKRHYEKEIADLTFQLQQLGHASSQRYEELGQKLGSNDKDVDALLDGLTNKTKAIENVYGNKNKLVIELLAKLARVAKLHGQESKELVQDNVVTLTEILAKHPDLQQKLRMHEKVDIDVESILHDTNETLSSTSFDEESTLISSPDVLSDSMNSKAGSRNSAVLSKKRKNKRNSIRVDSKSSVDFNALQPSNISNRRSQSFGKPHKQNSLDSHVRMPTPPANKLGDGHLDSTRLSNNENSRANHRGANNGNNPNNNNTKNKRRSIHGNPNNVTQRYSKQQVK